MNYETERRRRGGEGKGEEKNKKGGEERYRGGEYKDKVLRTFNIVG